MSKRPLDDSQADESARGPIVEWTLAWLMLLAAGLMLFGALASLLKG